MPDNKGLGPDAEQVDTGDKIHHFEGIKTNSTAVFISLSCITLNIPIAF